MFILCIHVYTSDFIWPLGKTGVGTCFEVRAERNKMSVLKVTKDNFNSEVKSSERTVLLDFYATWCGPCRMVGPIMEQIASERPDLLVGKIDVDEEPELARAFGVSSIPMLAVMRDGILVNAAVGARPKESILELVDN